MCTVVQTRPAGVPMFWQARVRLRPDHQAHGHGVVHYRNLYLHGSLIPC